MEHTMNRQNTEKQRTILSRVAALERMREPELREQWRALFGTEPPLCRPSVLVRRLSHRVQELACGAPLEEIKRRVEEKRAVMGLDDMALRRGRGGKRQAGTPVVGTRLVREWNGARCEVTVTGDGFEFQGKTYRSLSAVAKAITGTHWNGRAFFGLYKPGTGQGGRA
ncbi:MAG TPA: DUF2924 domain-containing protein [Candidatus Hydrogenedentes bacterium]|nr:DUF2924 domain-containing protein [Candidatus Hydrogenedentota bacterium]